MCVEYENPCGILPWDIDIHLGCPLGMATGNVVFNLSVLVLHFKLSSTHYPFGRVLTSLVPTCVTCGVDSCSQ